MLDTAEVRWFFQGTVPDGVHTWFHRPPTLVKLEPLRCDRYLLLTEIDSLGIKVRENRMEVKRRLQACPPTALAPQASGQVELWRKWSFELSALALELEPVSNTDAWIPVCKTRHIQTHIQGNDRLPQSGLGTAGTTWGYTFELTEVTLGSQHWWTLGLEAWGASDQDLLIHSLRAAIERTLSANLPISLSAEASYGYPRWLQLTCSRHPPGNLNEDRVGYFKM